MEIETDMANRRMLPKSISISKAFNSLDDFAGRLYLMTVPHLDDFGRVDGDAEIIKAMVMPLRYEIPVEDFESALGKIAGAGLIKIYEVNGIRVVLYPNFDKEQYGLNKRTKSDYPDPPNNSSEKFQEVPRNSQPSEANRSEPNSTQEKSTEANESQNSEIAVKNSTKGEFQIINPKTFQPINEGETAAFGAWKALEPNNPDTLRTTYLWFYRQGLPADLFYQFISEIKQDPSVKNAGAIFRKKAEDYLSTHKKK